MAINPHRKGGSDVPVADGGTGASSGSAGLSNLGGLDSAGHALEDHTNLPGTLGLRRELMLPKSFGYGQLLARPSLGAPAASAAEAGFHAIGATVDDVHVSSLGAAAPGPTPLGRVIDFPGGAGAGATAIHSPGSIYLDPVRMVAQIAGGAVPTNGQVFVGFTTAPTAVGSTTLIGGVLACFGIGYNFADTTWQVVADGAKVADTAIAAAAPPFFVVLAEAPAGTWTVEMIDVGSLTTIYGPTPFAGVATGAHGSTLYTQSGGGGSGGLLSIWGVTIGPEL